MSKTWHGKKHRLANLEGRHHEHGVDDLCTRCGARKRNGKTKREQRLLREAKRST